MPKWFKVSNWQASRLFCFLFWFLKGFPNVNFRNSMSLRIGYVTKGLHTRSIMCPEWKWILALTFPNFTFTIFFILWIFGLHFFHFFPGTLPFYLGQHLSFRFSRSSCAAEGTPRSKGTEVSSQVFATSDSVSAKEWEKLPGVPSCLESNSVTPR